MPTDAFDTKAFLKTLKQGPGVYQMFDERGDILYVGKARNLKNRVSSYFSGRAKDAKTQALVSRIDSIQVTLTHTEAEALILEHNLIKDQSPPYNILLKDDKSYPYIRVSDGEWPRVAFHRGAKRFGGQYFGPYPNSYAAREAMVLLQKVFKVRQCEDSFFRNRSRPCLQYQIERCTGPCVGLVSKQDYDRDVERTLRFLRGENEELVSSLVLEMQTAAERQDYEKAAALRDSVAQLREIQAEQGIESGSGNLDVVSAAVAGDAACVHTIFVRQGRVIASRSWYPKPALAQSPLEVIADFLPQYYLLGEERNPPAEIVVAEHFEMDEAFEQALVQTSGRRIRLTVPRQGRKRNWLDLASRTAEQNLAGKLAAGAAHQKRLQDLADALGVEQLSRIECFDISHHAGSETVASCVVFGTEGAIKSDYRKFNIENIQGGDDYAAMEQALRRRFKRMKKGEGQMSDLLVIDGGKGQLRQAIEVLDSLEIDQISVLGVAKGPTRKSGWEKLYFGREMQELSLESHSPAFHLLQQVRDEAHRFAVAGHTARKNKRIQGSPLDEIAGVGAKRKKALLHHFGGLQGIKSAGVADLTRVEGINRRLAEDIYSHFHNQ